MRIAIVGASGAGLYAAIFVKRRHPDFKVDVFDRAEKTGKKLLATGNGHCNLLNAKLEGKAYNHPEFIDDLLTKCPLSVLLDELKDLGIHTLQKGDLIYPLSYSASSYVTYLASLAESLGVKFHLGVEVTDYQVGDQITLITKEGSESFDRVIFATGGCSQPNLGSNGGLFNVIKKHGYEIVPLEPSLCPLKTKEKTKLVSGLRHEAKITLLQDGKSVYEEVGELLFKDDGISGIAVFNASAYLARDPSAKYEVVVDFFPAIEEKDLEALLEQISPKNPSNPYGAILEQKLCKYLEFAGKMQQDSSFAHTLKNTNFHIEGRYPFAASQVTSGGISIKEIGPDFQSQKEKNVFFIGEMLDIDGLCGGYNLGFALLSAYVLGRAL